MSIFDFLLLSMAVAMDAFAVSVAKGLSVQKLRTSNYFCVGAWFGGFQALMPLIGYFVGIHFAALVDDYDHWIAFALLAMIGINMLKEAFGDDEEEKTGKDFSFKVMLLMAIATSIDALAVGVSLAFMKENIWLAITLMGVITGAFSAAGLQIGHLFGRRYKSPAEVIGGLLLIFIGIKILWQHMAV